MKVFPYIFATVSAIAFTFDFIATGVIMALLAIFYKIDGRWTK